MDIRFDLDDLVREKYDNCKNNRFFLKNYYLLDSAVSKVIFIGLASLTFPHILLEYLIEKK